MLTPGFKNTLVKLESTDNFPSFILYTAVVLEGKWLTPTEVVTSISNDGELKTLKVQSTTCSTGI